jgi:predicted SAM-dependent methyltransferase
MSYAKMINIGCGNTIHADWINLDIAPALPSVLKVNIIESLPFSSEFADVCYSSHVLEHLNKCEAANLVVECFRVLKSDGVVRFVLPDLEALAREYIRLLEDVSSGDEGSESAYDWIMLELYDQTVRNTSGGEMAYFLTNLKESHRGFVQSRIGAEASNFWNPKQIVPSKFELTTFIRKISLARRIKLIREKLAGLMVYLIAGKIAYKNYKVGVFRSSGEVHQWMYDRYSVQRLLEQAGFDNVKICAANESRISNFEKYSLDVLDGVVRKPDSLFVEATKP